MMPQPVYLQWRTHLLTDQMTIRYRARVASWEDPSDHFNSSLEGNTRRAIDFHERDKIDEKALTALIRAAVAVNTPVRATARPVRSQKRPKSAWGAS
jgi:hypothetical protein